MERALMYGPLPPLRGGVARHTLHLAEAIARKTELTVLTPSKLYPALLYPGKSQHEPEAIRRPPIPFSVIRSSDFRIILGLTKIRKIDFAVIPWWTVARFLQTFLASLILRTKGVKVIMVCHNVNPHSRRRFEKLLTGWVLRLAHHHTVQSKAEAAQLKALVPLACPQLTPHPAWPIAPLVRAKAPTIPTFLFFGFVREYKGIRTVIAALNELEKSLNLRIIVMGEVWDRSLQQLLQDSCSKDRRLIVRSGYASQDVAQEALRNCSAVLLPYLSATGSGVLADAKSHKIPVIASDISPFSDEVREGRDGLLVKAGDTSKLANAIRKICQNQDFGNQAWETNQFDWDNFADEILSTRP
jgi:glycosyltransferase involved in cell wall biosynthesis